MTTVSHLSLVFMLMVSIIGAWEASMAEARNHIDREQSHKYGEALLKSILFFEGQRSGKLPRSQRLKWRKDSGLHDGHDIGVDLVGGYHDAGDNVKFGFPMAFTTTMLSWSIIEFGFDMGRQLRNALQAVRWGTDFLLKATSDPNKIYVGVGDPYADHDCWQRPEDMDTPRTVYYIDSSKPGSEVAGETAAALAAASIVFQLIDPRYSDLLLRRAVRVFEFADTYRGSYNISLGRNVCPFYCDWSGYEDELIWGATWLYKASKQDSYKYWQYILNNIHWLEPNVPSVVGEFGWDNKRGGIYVLLYQDLIESSDYRLFPFRSVTNQLACAILPESPTKIVDYSPGGLIVRPVGSNLQNPSVLSFLLIALAQRLHASNSEVRCSGNIIVPPSRLVKVAKSQVDYILGENPLKMSYMVGYGSKFPLRIHHRGSSVPSIVEDSNKLSCKGGTKFYESPYPNPNLLIGAIVGGPDINDQYADSRSLFSQSEPTTYINAPMVGVLAYFRGHPFGM